MTSLSIMGVGKVGAEVAYLSTVTQIADTINIYDSVPSLLTAQKLDLLHTGIDINLNTDPEMLTESDIIVFSAGMPRTPDIKTRADLLESNLPVAREFCRMIKNYDGIVITITNPMDANNYFIQKESGIKREKCIGFGGQLDLARLKYFLSKRGYDTKGAWVMGEHGEHQVPVFSGMKEEVPENIRNEILLEMRGASMPVIKGKGGTVFGPAYNVFSLIKAIINDENKLLPCSCVLRGEYNTEGCSICVPVRVGRNGISEIIECHLDSWEEEKFSCAASHLKDLCRRV
ncbi:lactate dehydrogenase [Methanoplanus sp. FWC-SCC4]|uniref:malate dehydrogenase n=1 Tax=Methanochimaera problematica TaxID=2609417 RepID=A0AA97I2J8_9EURY|nr:lactate dehydrogenase [Methanoplanus sp. FWC-SCC4]WOF15688.1 lactate dehydrogenase [Methanoplanus sp. FWC-SCC4]